MGWFDLVRSALFETLYFGQASFKNPVYYFQAFVNFTCPIALLVHENYQWDTSLVQYPFVFLQTTALGVQLTPGFVFYPVYGAFTLLVGATMSIGSFIAYGLLTASLEHSWVAAVFQKLLGLVMTFVPPSFLKVWLAVIDCDYFKEGRINAMSLASGPLFKDSGLRCADSTFYASLWGVSLLMSFAFIITVLCGSLVHRNDPLVFSVVARPHSILDTSAYMAILFNTLITTFAREEPLFCGIVFTACYGLLAFLCITVQPYYSRTMTDTKSAFNFCVTYTGIAFIALNVLVDESNMDDHELRRHITIGYFIGFIPSLVLGWLLSAYCRNYTVQKALRPYHEFYTPSKYSLERYVFFGEHRKIITQNDSEFQFNFQINAKRFHTIDHKTKTHDELQQMILDGDGETIIMSEGGCEVKQTVTNHGVPSISDDDVYDAVCHDFKYGVALSLYDWWKCLRIEVGTRFLQYDKQTVLPPSEMIDIGEHVLKKGLIENPQSTYLLLQNMIFTIAYRQNYQYAHKKLEDMEKQFELGFQLGFGCFRKRRDLDRKKQESHFGATASLDTMGFEEVKKQMHMAVLEHRRTLTRLGNIWKALKRDISHGGRQTVELDVLSAMVERVAQSEKISENAYMYVLQRCPDAATILKQYSVFLKTVKKNHEAAAQVDRRINQIANKGRGGSAASVDAGQPITALTTAAASKGSNNTVVKLRQRMGLTSVFLLIFTLAMFTAYFIHIQKAEVTIVNLIESGMRRYYTQGILEGIRSMHIAAIRDDMDQFETARMNVRNITHDFWYVHTDLMLTNRPTLAELNDFYTNPTDKIEFDIPSTKNNREPRELYTSASDSSWRFITAASLATLREPEVFKNFDKFAPKSFFELYIVFQNAGLVSQVNDEATGLYQKELNQVAMLLRILCLVFSGTAIAIELWSVISIFRQLDMGSELKQVLITLQAIPDYVVEFKLEQQKRDTAVATKAHKRFEEGKGVDGGESETEVATELESDLGSEADMDEGAIEKKQKSLSQERDKRRRMLNAVYYFCLVFIVCVMSYMCNLFMEITEITMRTASDINGADRRLYLGKKMSNMATEYVLMNNPEVSLTDGNVGDFSSPELIQCVLRRTAESMISVHYAVVYGYDKGWVDQAVARSFPNGQVQHSQQDPTSQIGDYCSPFTWNKETFEAMADSKGSVARYLMNDDLLFKSNCLTELPNDVSGDSFVFNNQRTKYFADEFNANKCVMYNNNGTEGSHEVRQGLHLLVGTMADAASILGQEDPRNVYSLTPDNEHYRILRHFDGDEWHLGLLKAVILYTYEIMSKMSSNTIMTIFLTVLTCMVIFVQHWFLGFQIQMLMGEHQGMTQVVEGMLTEAVALEEKLKKEGITKHNWHEMLKLREAADVEKEKASKADMVLDNESDDGGGASSSEDSNFSMSD